MLSSSTPLNDCKRFKEWNDLDMKMVWSSLAWWRRGKEDWRHLHPVNRTWKGVISWPLLEPIWHCPNKQPKDGKTWHIIGKLWQWIRWEIASTSVNAIPSISTKRWHFLVNLLNYTTNYKPKETQCFAWWLTQNRPCNSMFLAGNTMIQCFKPKKIVQREGNTHQKKCDLLLIAHWGN